MSAQSTPLENPEKARISDKERTFLTGSRETKVFAALLVSMIVGLIILRALGSNPPSAGAFCLLRYYRLEPVEKAILSRAAQLPGCWSRIEIYYSGTGAGNSERSAPLNGLAGPEDINYHFVVCNNGQIKSTEKWQRQLPVSRTSPNHEPRTRNSRQTMRICVVADGKTARSTEFQIKRTEALVEGLSRRFNIQPESIHYPDNWQWRLSE